jgi:glycosyltransferase involved in cell wall biosynthesis
MSYMSLPGGNNRMARSVNSHFASASRIAVRFLGGVTSLKPVLDSADVFVMPSLYEGFGVAAVEALVAGLPVVLSDVPGLRDFGKYTDSIRWCAPRADDLIEHPGSLLEMSSSKRRRMGAEAGAARYADLYSKRPKESSFGRLWAPLREKPGWWIQ